MISLDFPFGNSSQKGGVYMDGDRGEFVFFFVFVFFFFFGVLEL